MPSWLLYTLGVVIFALGLVLSIALHEIGHMVPAKKFGVKVTQYMVGFGQTIWSVKRGDTEYGVKAFPLGGYIRMVGMLPPPKLDANAQARGITRGFFGRLIADARAAEDKETKTTDESRLFYRLAWWKKVIVMAGGPMMNVVLAILLLGAVFMGIGLRTPSLDVAEVSECVLATALATDCSGSTQASPAQRAGLQAGDRVVSFNGSQVESWDQLSRAIQDNGAGRAVLGVVRDGKAMTLTTNTVVAPRPGDSVAQETVEVGFLGVTPGLTRERQSFGFVVSTMGDYTKRTGSAITQMPQRMVGVFKAAVGIEDRDPESPMSVVGASRVAGEVATTDTISWTDRWAMLLTLLGVVNLFVALFNFIPLLPLDGGHIAGALYEAATRGIARLRGRPDPGYADVAQLLPIAYGLASVLIVMGVVLIWADIVNPITLAG